MDSQTRHALKQDKFIEATQGSVSWISQHRSTAIRLTVIAVAVLIVVVAGAVYYNSQQAAAQGALGAALDTYSAPLAPVGTPAGQNVFFSASDRAKSANQQFLAVADKYGWLPGMSKAHYFAGLTDSELGQTAAAVSELKKAASSWNSNEASLANFALAGVYHQSGSDQQAIEIYQQLGAKGTQAVPAYTAQLALADLYAATGKQEQAKQIWAKIKDGDKDGAAGTIATQKLTAKN